MRTQLKRILLLMFLTYIYAKVDLSNGIKDETRFQRSASFIFWSPIVWCCRAQCIDKKYIRHKNGEYFEQQAFITQCGRLQEESKNHFLWEICIMNIVMTLTVYMQKKIIMQNLHLMLWKILFAFCSVVDMYTGYCGYHSCTFIDEGVKFGDVK